MTVQDHPLSMILAPIKNVYGTSYWSSIVTLVLSCPVSKLLQLLCAESDCFNTPPNYYQIPAKILGCSLCMSRSVMLCSAERRKLIRLEIVFEVIQPMLQQYVNITDGQTDGWIDDLI